MSNVQLYKYDAHDRLIEVKRKSDNAVLGEYEYDALGFGRRTKKVVGSATTRYVYSDLQSVEELDGSGNLRRLYAFGERIDNVVLMEAADAADVDNDSDTSETMRFHFQSQLIGSVTTVTAAAQTVVESYEYDPYGIITIKDKAGSTVSASPIGNSYTYAGRQLEEESELYYYRARHYSAELRRFVQSDPAGYVDGPNALAYVSGSPIGSRDPLGLQEEHTSKARPSTEDKHTRKHSGDPEAGDRYRRKPEPGAGHGSQDPFRVAEERALRSAKNGTERANIREYYEGLRQMPDESGSGRTPRTGRGQRGTADPLTFGIVLGWELARYIWPKTEREKYARWIADGRPRTRPERYPVFDDGRVRRYSDGSEWRDGVQTKGRGGVRIVQVTESGKQTTIERPTYGPPTPSSREADDTLGRSAGSPWEEPVSGPDTPSGDPSERMQLGFDGGASVMGCSVRPKGPASLPNAPLPDDWIDPSPTAPGEPPPLGGGGGKGKATTWVLDPTLLR